MYAITNLLVVIMSVIILQVSSSPVATSFSYRIDGDSGYERSYGINRIVRSSSDQPTASSSYTTFIVHGKPMSYGSYPAVYDNDLSFYDDNGEDSWRFEQPTMYTEEYWPQHWDADGDSNGYDDGSYTDYDDGAYSEYDDGDDDDDYSENTFFNQESFGEGYRNAYDFVPGYGNRLDRVNYHDGEYQHPSNGLWIKF